MTVIYYDTEPKAALGNVRVCATLDEVLQKSMFVSVHVPATDQTRNLIGRREIELLKKGSYLINYARGTVVDVEATAEALRSGHLAGASFDVFPEEVLFYFQSTSFPLCDSMVGYWS
eukprot:m.800839 g.800839  ORF g.800839 m.800839 type:complete len:117 (-) comp59272_c0_seq13:5516-5866(-)